MSEVVIDVNEFMELYPKFSNLTNEELNPVLRLIELYIENNQFSVVADLEKRKSLLYLMIAHLCYLTYGDKDGNGGSGVVGRLSSASEGSVSVGATVGQLSSDAEWYAQSQYGWEFWEATKVYRMGAWYSGADYY